MKAGCTFRQQVAVWFVLVAIAGSGCGSTRTTRGIKDVFQDALAQSRRSREQTRQTMAAANVAASEPSANSPSRGLDDAYSDSEPFNGGPPVSDVFVETDIREAIQSIATQARVVVAMDDAVRGTSTAAFEEAPFESALETLLLPHGFACRRVDDRYFVGTNDPESAMFPHVAESFEYRPRFLTTEELQKLAPSFASTYLTASPRRGVMVVTAPRRLAMNILRGLVRADQPIPQVVLECLVCEYSPSKRTDLGFDFVGGVKTGGGNGLNLGISDLAANALVAPLGTPDLKSFEFFSAYVRALASEGHVSIRAAPRITALDGERAMITIGEETYFTVGDGNNFLRELKPVQSGIILDCTPHIRGETVSVRIERAEVSDELRPSALLPEQDGHLPTVKTRRVSTTVRVRDGQMIVTGGLTRRRTVQREIRVPVLGSIPGLGLLFKRVETREEETEVAVFICPRIQKEP